MSENYSYELLSIIKCGLLLPHIVGKKYHGHYCKENQNLQRKVGEYLTIPLLKILTEFNKWGISSLYGIKKSMGKIV